MRYLKPHIAVIATIAIINNSINATDLLSEASERLVTIAGVVLIVFACLVIAIFQIAMQNAE